MASKQKHQQQQQQMRASRTMPQLNYTEADIQEQYLSTMGVRVPSQRSPASVEGQANNSRRPRGTSDGQPPVASSSSGRLGGGDTVADQQHESLRWRRSQQLAKFDDSAAPSDEYDDMPADDNGQFRSSTRGNAGAHSSGDRVGGFNDQDGQTAELENVRPTRSTSSSKLGDSDGGGGGGIKRKRRSRSASRLLSACLNIPAQLASSISSHHQQLQTAAHKTKASSILSHFRIGHHHHHNHNQNHHQNQNQHGVHMNHENGPQQTDEDYPQMGGAGQHDINRRPLSNSRTLGDLKSTSHLQFQDSSQESPSGGAGGAGMGHPRMKHVSFGEHQNQQQQQQQQQQQALLQATNETQQNNVIAAGALGVNSRQTKQQPTTDGGPQVADMQPAHHLAAGGGGQAAVQPHQNQRRPPGGAGPTNSQTARLSQPAPISRQPAPLASGPASHHQVPGSPHFKQPLQHAIGVRQQHQQQQQMQLQQNQTSNTIYKRLPNVPMRTQATQTEITAYHLVASPSGQSSVGSCSLAGTLTRNPQSADLGGTRRQTTTSGTLATAASLQGGELDSASVRLGAGADTPSSSQASATTTLAPATSASGNQTPVISSQKSISASSSDQQQHQQHGQQQQQTCQNDNQQPDGELQQQRRRRRRPGTGDDDDYEEDELMAGSSDINKVTATDEEETELELGQSLRATLLNSSSNSSSSVSLVGHDLALADTLKCDLRIGTSAPVLVDDAGDDDAEKLRPVGEGPAVGGAAPSSSPPPPIQSHRTSIIKPATGPTTLTDSKAMPTTSTITTMMKKTSATATKGAPSAVAEANNNNNNKLANDDEMSSSSLLNNRERRGRQREEIEPPNKFKDAGGGQAPATNKTFAAAQEQQQKPNASSSTTTSGGQTLVVNTAAGMPVGTKEAMLMDHDHQDHGHGYAHGHERPLRDNDGPNDGPNDDEEEDDDDEARTSPPSLSEASSQTEASMASAHMLDRIGRALERQASSSRAPGGPNRRSSAAAAVAVAGARQQQQTQHHYHHQQRRQISVDNDARLLRAAHLGSIQQPEDRGTAAAAGTQNYGLASSETTVGGRLATQDSSSRSRPDPYAAVPVSQQQWQASRIDLQQQQKQQQQPPPPSMPTGRPVKSEKLGGGEAVTTSTTTTMTKTGEGHHHGADDEGTALEAEEAPQPATTAKQTNGTNQRAPSGPAVDRSDSVTIPKSLYNQSTVQEPAASSLLAAKTIVQHTETEEATEEERKRYRGEPAAPPPSAIIMHDAGGPSVGPVAAAAEAGGGPRSQTTVSSSSAAALQRRDHFLTGSSSQGLSLDSDDKSLERMTTTAASGELLSLATLDDDEDDGGGDEAALGTSAAAVGDLRHDSDELLDVAKLTERQLADHQIQLAVSQAIVGRGASQATTTSTLSTRHHSYCSTDGFQSHDRAELDLVGPGGGGSVSGADLYTNRLEDDDDDGDDNGEQEHENGDIQNEEAEDDDENGEQDEEASDEFVVLSGRQLSKDQGREQERATMVVAPDAASTVELTELATTKTATIATTDEIAAAAADAIRHGDLSDTSSTSSSCASGQTLKSTRRRSSSSLRVALTKGSDDEPSGNDDGSTKAAPSSSIGGENPTSLLVGAPSGKTPATSSSLGEHELANQSGAGLVVVSGGGGERVEEEEADEGKEVKEEGARNRGDTTTTVSEWPANGPNKGPTNGAALAEAANDDNAKRAERICAVVSEQRQTQQSPGRSGAINLHDDDTAATTTSKSTLAHKMPTTTTKTTLNKNERNAGAEPGLVAGLDAEQGRDGDKGGRQEGPESLKELGQHQPSRSSPSLSSSSSSSSSSASSSRRTHSKSSKSSSSAGSSSSSSSSSCSSARSAAPRRSSSSKLTPATSKQQPAIPSEPLEKPSVPTKQPKQQLESSVGGADGDGDKIAQATTSAAASLERKTSSPSPPTTVSDLDQDEELSTPSFVDTYKRRLEDHVNELADSFSATLIDEGLAAAAAAAVRDEVEDEDEERNSDNNNKRANEPELLGPQNVIGTSAGPGSTTVVPSQAVSLSRSSSSSSTSTTSAGGSSYVRLESGRLERRSKARLSQTNAASQEQQQQQQSSAKPELPKKPAHLVVVAPTLAHHHQAGAPLASQSRVQPQSEFSSNLQDDHHGERATAVAVTATSIAAARAMHANGKSTTPSTLAAATTTTTTPTTTTLDIDLKAARRQDGRREEAVAQVRRETSATQATTIRQASVDSGRRKPPRYTTKAASMDQTMEPVSAGGIGAGDDSRKPIRIDRSSSSDGQQQQPPSSRRAVQFVTHTEPVKQEPIKEANETPPGSQEQKAGQSGSSPGTPPSDDLHHQVASSATGKEPPSPVEHQSGQLGRATVQVVPSLADRQSPSSSCLAPTANQQLVRTGQPSANSAEGDIYDNDESGDGDELDEAAAAAIAASKLVAGHENSGAGEQLDAGEQSPVELSTVSEASDELLSGSVSSSAKQQLSSASGSSMGAATGAGDSRHEGPSAQLDAGVQVSSQAAPVGPAAVTTAKTPAASLIRQLSSGSFESRASSASQTPPPASQAQAVGAAAANRAQRHSLISGEQPGGSPLKLQHPSSGTIKTGQSQLQARSSPPVDCPYVTTMTTPAKITTEKRPSVGAAATAGHHLVSGGPAASGTPSVDGAGAAAAASAAITSPNNSSSAASSQATAPTQPPISNSATPNFPSKRLSHDDTMEAIEDDVEGEEQEMKLLDELRQQQRLTGQQSPANIAPPAGFCSGPHPLLGATSRPSSSLGGPSPVSGQSIQEEDEDEEEEEGENKPGPAHLADTETSATTTTTTAESRGKVEHSSGEEDDEDEEEDEESSISVSQKHGVVVTTTTQVESSSSRRARSTCSPGRFDNTKDKSSIRMKRFKRSSSNSSSSSSSSMGDGSNRATPMVSSPTSSPSKSSQADSTGSATISSTRSPADSPKTGSPARGAEDNDSQSDNQSESQRELLLKTPTREHPNSNNDLVTGKGTSPPKANEHELPLPTSYSSMPETVGDEIHSHLKQQQQQSAAGPLTGHGEQSKLAGKTTATASSTASTTTSHSHSHSGDSTESATHAILEHLSRHHHPGSLASGMAHLDEPAPSLELCRSIDPQQRRASWLRESETSRGASSTNGASPVRSQTAATSSGSSTTAEHSVNAGRPVVVSGSSRQAGPEGEHQHPASGTATASTTTVTRNKGGHVEGTTATTATDGAAGVGRGVGVDVDAGDHVDVVEPHLPASFIDSPSRTGTMKRRRNEPAAAPEAPGAAATTTTNRNRQVDSMPTTAATAVEMDSAAPIGAKPDPSQARSSGLVASVTAETGAAVNPAASGDQAPAKRPPPLGKLKSPQTADDQQQQQPQQQLQQQQQQSSSLDRADVDGSICSSCSCMDASFDQTIAAREPMPQISEVTPSTSRQQQQQSQQQQQRQQQQQKQQQQQRGSLASASSSWMSQEEGTVFTENYWLSHWLYISEHEEAEIWKRAIDLGRSSGGGGGASQEPGGSEKQQRQKVARDATAVAAAGSRARARLEAGLPEDMSETASTTSERTFNTRYKSTTRKMIHRRASIEMFKRIMANNLKKEKRVEISRSSVGEFGFRIHGSRPVVVSAIERGTSAETCGLQVGDLIYAINDTNILDMAHSDVVRLAHDAGSSALILDLIPTNGFLQSTRYSRRENKRYEPTVTGYLMRLSPSTAQPLLIELQERMSSGGSASGSGHGNSAAATSQQRAIELNKVMRLAWRARYFVLRSDNCLYWYKSPDEMVEPHGGLNLQGFSATLTDEFSEPDYVIRLVKYGGQPHYLGSNNMCDIQTWVDAINRAATEANQNDPYMKRTLVLARGKPNQIEEPDCSGWLYKFSHKRGGGAHWRAAYFVLKDACLYLFRNQKAELVEQASAVYYLHGYRVRSKHIEHKKHTFELIPPNRKTIKPMFLMASNEIDKKRWIAALEYSIDRWIEIN